MRLQDIIKMLLAVLKLEIRYTSWHCNVEPRQT